MHSKFIRFFANGIKNCSLLKKITNYIIISSSLTKLKSSLLLEVIIPKILYKTQKYKGGRMSPKLFTIITIIVFVIIGVSYNISSGITDEGEKRVLIKKGEYLVTIGGCNDCHTPKIFTETGMKLDTERLLSGHPSELIIPEIPKNVLQSGNWVLMNPHLTAAVGPWGISFAANLTPDEQTGIGLWKESNFVAALKSGKHMGAGRPILPPMPWENMALATDDDLKAIFAYLTSIPPVKNRVPQPIPPNEIGK